ncbi:MAG: adenylate cyclase class 2 [Anaerolineaceae bacterium]|nr:MAG: adenylate cyclase class 2 [Anaerolineaceae bacterium]
MDSSGLEIEAKFHLANLPEVERRVRQLGGRLVQPRVLEMNYRFDTPTGDLRPAKRVLRLRKDHACHLTYKAPGSTTDGVSTRCEIETVIDDLEAARAILEALGYQVVFVYEKYRTVYALEAAHVMLDELPYGDFLEIEGEDKDIRALAGRLRLDWSAAVTAGYHALYERLRARRPLDPARLTFDSMQGLKIAPEELSVSPADA